MTPPIVIRVDGEPVGKGRPRFGGGRAFTPAKTRSYEESIAWAAKDAMGARPPIDGPVSILVTAAFRVPTSRSKAAQAMALAGEVHHTGRPDGDNILKCAGDALNRIVFQDDSQIVDARVRKVYAAAPSLTIVVEAL